MSNFHGLTIMLGQLKRMSLRVISGLFKIYIYQLLTGQVNLEIDKNITTKRLKL